MKLRFTVRRSMVVVAIVAVAVVALLVIRDYIRLAETSARFAVAAEKYGEYAGYYEQNTPSFSSCYGGRWDAYSSAVARDVGRHSSDKAYRDAKAAYYRRLARDYAQATNKPWLTVAPDPPEPE